MSQMVLFSEHSPFKIPFKNIGYEVIIERALTYTTPMYLSSFTMVSQVQEILFCNLPLINCNMDHKHSTCKVVVCNILLDLTKLPTVVKLYISIKIAQ